MATNLRNIKANALFSSVPSMTVTGNSTIDNVNLTGNIIPDVSNAYSLGTASYNFKDIYVGPGSLYVNGKKVLEEVSGTITFTTDINQNLKITTSGSGDIQFDPTGTGVISIKGPLQIEAGINITSSDGFGVHFANPVLTDSITTHSANTDLSLSANGTGTIKLNDDVTVSGNLTVSGTTTYINTETVQLYDNIIDLNSNFTTGTPTENAGVRVLRGDDPAVLVRWNETTDKWQYTTDGSAYVDIVGTTSLGATSLGNSATANYFTGNGSLLTAITGSNVSGNVNIAVQSHYANIANSVSGTNVSGNVTSAVQSHYANIANSVAVANVSGIGNISTINIDGNANNILYGNGVFATTPASGGSYGNSNVATFLANYGSNAISTTGNVSVGNIIGNGQSLTSISGANVIGAVSYATTANAVAGANVSGFVENANIANTAYSVAVANVSGIGNIATINKDGNVSNILYGNGVFAAAPAGGGGSYGDSNVVTLLTSFGSNTISTTGNISVGNLNATTGVVASRLTSNVATGTAPLTVTSTTRVANLNVAYANVTDYVGTGTAQNGNFNITLQSGTSGNIQPLGNSAFIANATSGTLFATLFTGTLTTAVQPNITSVGTLTTLTSGTHTISANANITMSGSLSQVSGANLVSANYGAFGGQIPGQTFNFVARSTDNVIGTFAVQATVANNYSGASFFDNSNALQGSVGYANPSTTYYPGQLYMWGSNGIAFSGNGYNTAGGTKNMYITSSGIVTIPTGVSATNTTTGAFVVTGGVGISGNLYAGNLSGTNITGTLTTGAQPNITSTGSLTGLTVSNATGIVNFTTTANVTLGAVANLHISGGSADYVLKTDGAGNLSWVAQSGGGGGGSPGGSNTQIQFNDAGSFGGTANLTFDKTSNTLSATNLTSGGTVNFTTASNVSLGSVGNIKIAGGSADQVLKTDGTGNLSWVAQSGGGGSSTSITIIAVTDETSNITVSSSRMSFRAPIAMTLTGIPRASLATASSSGLVTCDIKLNGTTILGANKLSIDANESTSVTAATATTLVTTSIPDDGLITIDITSAGTGAKGLKITFYS